jgi:hypothetical protein
MSKLIWIDGTSDFGGYGETLNRVGDIGYLTEVTSYRNGCVTTHRMSDTPCHTNMSREPRLHGWCGETDNVSRSASGVWEVVRVAKNGRVQIREVTDADRIRAYLDETGYPQLADEIEVAA